MPDPPKTPGEAGTRPRVTVIALVDAAERGRCERLATDVRAQRGVDAELVVVDASVTESAAPAAAKVRTVAAVGVGRGVALRAALEHVDTDLVALADPHCRPLAGWLGRAADALAEHPEARLATCDYLLDGDGGQPVDRAHPAAMGEAPGPFWHAGLVLRRSALETIDTRAHRASELSLYQRERRAGRCVHVTEPGFAVELARYRERWEASRADARLLALDRRPYAGARPRLSILCAIRGRSARAECLAALGRQEHEHGEIELVLVDDGAADGAPELERIEFPLPTRVVRPAQRGRAAALNAGLEACRGERVLFVDDDLVALPGLVAEHLRAHRRFAARGPVAVAGSLEPAARDDALARCRGVDGGGEPRPRDGFATRNVSAPLELVRAAGGFDVAFEDDAAGDLDLGLRLAELGLRVYRQPSARARDHRRLDPDELARRRRAEARASVRLYTRHPDALAGSGDVAKLTLAACSATWRAHAAEVPALEDAARELARLDVGALERLGSEFEPVAAAVVAELDTLIATLTPLWAARGYAQGFREHGLAGFGDLARAARPRKAAVRPPDPPPPAREPELSVVVPTHDRPDELVQLVEALAGQDLEVDRFEVIVVDDGSAAPAAERLRERDDPFALRVLRQEGGGPGCARNAGVAVARGDVVLFLNDDALPRPDLLGGHLRAHRAASEERAVLGAFPLRARHRVDAFAELVETTDLMFAQPRMKPGVLYDGAALCTGNVSLPRAALVAVGGFDEALPFAGGEDSELGQRLEREQGLRVLYDPDLVAEHDHALDVLQYARRQRVLGWTVHAIVRKHGDPSLVTGSPEVPLDDELLAAIAAANAADEVGHDERIAALEERARTERARGGFEAAELGAVEAAVRLVGRVEFRRGLLAAQAGVPAARLFERSGPGVVQTATP